ncbi:16322_t:CDS:2, partial [Funneliformis geosporum]
DKGKAHRKNWKLAQNLQAYTQTQNWHRHYKDKSREHQKRCGIIQRLEGAMINNDTRNGNQIGDLNTAGEFQDKAAAKIGRIGAGVTTAGGEPVDNAPVTPNARDVFLLLLLLLVLSLINFYTCLEPLIQLLST